MNFVILFIVIILCFTTNNYTHTDCLFAKIGKSVFTSENNYDECGFTYIQEIYNISYQYPKCFAKPYPNQIYYYPIPTENNSMGMSPPQSRISWGREAKWAEAPWAAHILFKSRFGFDNRICSGSLITLEWVLTAAHCFEDLPSSYTTTVSAGDPKMNTPQVREGVKKFVHDSYWYNSTTKDKTYDIGLIKVNKPFIREIYQGMKYQVNPVCLPEKRSGLNDQVENAILYGFGIGKWVPPNSLQRADFSLQIHYTIHMYPNNTNYGCKERPTLLCAQVYWRQPRFCTGDSGAGLIQRDENRRALVVIGVASEFFPGSDNGCLDENSRSPYMNFFAPVPNALDWIYETIKNN